MIDSPDKTGKKQTRGRFLAGESGNPAGRPKGARNRTTMAVQALLEGDAPAVARRAIDAALAGDMVAIRLVLDRIAPAPRDRVVQFELPVVASVSDVPQIMIWLLRAVAAGEIAPAEADSVAKLAEQYRRSVETADIDARLKVLEEIHVNAR